MKQTLIFKRGIPLLLLIAMAFISYRFVSVSENKTNEIIQDKGMSVAEFQKKVSQDKLVLVYFNASWCAPCAKLKPEINELENETRTYCEVLQVNTDDHPRIADFYEINSLPMFVLYKNGKKLWENDGALSKTQLQLKIDAFR